MVTQEQELESLRIEVERLRVFQESALGLICNAHSKTVDFVTDEDGATPGWAGAARLWIDAYPYGALR